MDERFAEILGEHWPRTKDVKLTAVASELVEAIDKPYRIEDLRARIPWGTIEFGNAVIEVDANNNVVSIEFREDSDPNPIY